MAMTTSSVFGATSIANRPEFAGVNPVEQYTPPQPQVNPLEEQLRLEQEKAKLLQDAVAKFLNKEITKVELETVQQSLK